MTGLLEEQVALIAGVGEGLGRDISLLFAEHGAALVLMSRTDTVTRSVAEEIEARESDAFVVHGDATDPTDCARIVQEALGRYGKVDVLVNVFYLRANERTLIESDEQLTDWRAAFEVNLFAPLQLIWAVAPHMIENGNGRIVLVGTTAVNWPLARRGSYAASKQALETAARTIAVELAPKGVRVNVVHPGWMDGLAVAQAFQRLAAERGTTAAEEREKLVARIPLGYIPPTREYAGPILFLASELSRPLVGESLHANGGQWLP